jgi:hypothetical protein
VRVGTEIILNPHPPLSALPTHQPTRGVPSHATPNLVSPSLNSPNHAIASQASTYNHNPTFKENTVKVIEDAVLATESDFWCVAPKYDRWVIAKFVVTYQFRIDNMNDEQWLNNLPKYVLPDVQRSIRNVNNTNRRMERDLNRETPREYVGRGNTSHRAPRKVDA